MIDQDQVRKLIKSERDAWAEQHMRDSTSESLGGFSSLNQLMIKLDFLFAPQHTKNMGD